MTKLEDLFPVPFLIEAISAGYVRTQVHPELPLAILNYTERAAYDNAWTPVTMACRGLIYDIPTKVVLARPFPKFFNYGQPGAPDLDLDAPAVVTDKLDGSLGILYPSFEWTSTGVAIATRGSFTSDQALHATEVWNERYPDVVPDLGVTYLFEIVYPSNRVVVDYEDLDDLILLGGVDIASGAHVDAKAMNWPGPSVTTTDHLSLSEALSAPPRANSEGLVVYLPHMGARVKIKQEDYVALHRIVTGLNKRTVWEHIGAGRPLEELVLPLPDEFRPWVEDVAAELSALVARQAREIEEEYNVIVAQLDSWTYVGTDGGPPFENEWKNEGVPDVEGKPWSRKQFASLASSSKWSWALFLRLDGKDYGPKLWQHSKPEATGPRRTVTGDVA